MTTTASAVGTQWITLAAMAVRLRMPWARAWRLVLEGKVKSEQRSNGRWFVCAADVERLAATAKKSVK
jgi:hypothetical protein